ncbi:MAG: hypothetical protein FJY10_03010 [Bacteroidetes bacterium]|nr:hypothetical protein [Bacteroidota bacterium]
MKRLFLFLVPVMAFFLQASAFAAPPKPFEGVITYKISYPGLDLPAEQQGMLPKLLIVKIKGTKSRSEINTPMGDQIEITDYVAKTKVGLIDVMGQKYAVKTNKEAIEKEMKEQGTATVQLTNETKEIAGYVCKKALININEDGVESTMTVYYTSEIGNKEANFDNAYFKDIDGALLEFQMKSPQFAMEFTATTVEKKTISSNEFVIPEGYKITTEEELKELFGGMGEE